ncbi:hypothetical protein EMCRGX_G025113 [Ephydatia muelleri]
MRLQERPTDQHAARSKCYRKDNGLRKIPTNKPQRCYSKVDGGSRQIWKRFLAEQVTCVTLERKTKKSTSTCMEKIDMVLQWCYKNER